MGVADGEYAGNDLGCFAVVAHLCRGFGRRCHRRSVNFAGPVGPTALPPGRIVSMPTQVFILDGTSD